MVRRKEPPGIESYYKAQEQMFNLQSQIMTGILSHYGERGRNDEKYLVEFLKKILPHRFGLGTGFIVSSDISQTRSNQTDIIIIDKFWNSPLYQELAAEVYPIETVFATIEVKGLISKDKKGRNRKSDLDHALESISKIRELAKSKHYVSYTAMPKSEEEPDKKVVYPEYYQMSLPPRSYIFTYAKKGWRDLNAFRNHLINKLKEYPKAHIHGIIVLEKNWFAFQEAYTGEDRIVHCFDDNCLLRFTNTLLRGIQSMPMGITSIDHYHRAGLYSSVLAGDPSESAYDGDPEPSDASDDYD